MSKIYVASSWRNTFQPEVVRSLREAGHEVYDFRNPPHGKGGFKWASIDSEWENWSTREYISNLKHPVSESGFKSDLDAMEWAEVCVLVLPCGRSAHAEAGWMQGSGRKTIVYIPEKQEPELMYKLFDLVTDEMSEIIEYLNTQAPSV